MEEKERTMDEFGELAFREREATYGRTRTQSRANNLDKLPDC